MCGIAGYVAEHGARPERELLRRMCDRLQHRGPDGSGYYVDDLAAIGHRRLSIIDLEGGSQPFGNEDGSIQIVFNGEIYNFLELREELLQKGHQFRSRSDTEVLVHLYEEEGERLPERLNGMFAFAIWDSNRRMLFLARDRLGKKPLYYTEGVAGQRISFASELKALCAIPGFEPKVDRRSVGEFLSLAYIADPDTIYEDVRRLPAGSSMLVTDSGAAIRRYWTPPFEPAGSADVKRVVEEIQHLAADAVERRMISDVPLGGFLSGGVDSSAVVALMAQAAPDRVKSFSIGFTEKEFDELEYARAVAERYQTEHLEKTVSLDIHDMLGKLVEHYDEPFGDPSAIPTLYLSRMTREHVTVALSGDGADEVFGGYRRYYFGVLEEVVRSRFPRWFRKSVIGSAGRLYPKFDYMPQWLRGKTFLTNLAADLGDSYYTSMSDLRDGGLLAVLSPELREMTRHDSPRERFRARFQNYRELDPLSQMRAVDFETYLPGDILVKADRATMAYSLESRSPWLDYRLVELSGRLPPGMLLNGKSGKHIFKEAMRPHIPERNVTRRKMGFWVPLSKWFRTSLRGAFQTLALRDDMAEYLDLAEARRIFELHQTGSRDHSRELWNMLMLACWDYRHRQGKTMDKGVFAPATR